MLKLKTKKYKNIYIKKQRFIHCSVLFGKNTF